MEPQDPSSLLSQQQQQLPLSRQQMLRSLPQQQRSPLQPQSLSVRSSPPVMNPVYEPGMCARRLTHYMYQQRNRPQDNNIDFWRGFVAEFFAPDAKKKWCVSTYGSGRHTAGVLPQDIWQCGICNRKPGQGFEATVEVLPRLFKVKYESGTLEELLCVDMPRECHNSSGQIVLDYAKAVQESIFEQLRVVREGQLRIVFSPDLKICSWEFCAQRHEELVPRRLLIPQVSQLGAAAQKFQADANNSSSNENSASELQNNCNTFLASARQLAKALEVPLMNDLGHTKTYVRCLQISEVVNTMKDLIDFSRVNGTGPTESLTKFPRINNPSSGYQGSPISGPIPCNDAHMATTRAHQALHANSSGNRMNSPNMPLHDRPQSSVQRIINDVMISSSVNDGNRMSQGGPGHPTMVSGPQAGGAAGMPMANHHRTVNSNRLVSGDLGAVDGFKN